jgi:hypothetical protein
VCPFAYPMYPLHSLVIAVITLPPRVILSLQIASP